MHLVETMAYVGQQPWHSLGNPLTPGQPLEGWQREAGMDWTIEGADVRYVANDDGLGSIHAFPDQKVLYRSDIQTYQPMIPPQRHTIDIDPPSPHVFVLQ